MATRKQKAAAKRNIKKALAALRRKGRKHGHKKAHRSHKKGHRVHHRRVHHRKHHRAKRRGRIPQHVLERRLKKLASIVHKRRGR